MHHTILSDGFTILKSVFSRQQIDELNGDIESAFEIPALGTDMRTTEQTVFAARNLIDILPRLETYWKTDQLSDLLQQTLGVNCGLVRALWFDKPPDRSWSLPWHKDMTIAVKNNRLGGTRFRKPTTKAGVPHVEASQAVLDNMLTLRIHLDAATEDNGPLKVIPGSCHSGKAPDSSSRSPVTILASPGDVLAMRPLISHSSDHTVPDTYFRRRILHLEFSGERQLPDGYDWMWFKT